MEAKLSLKDGYEGTAKSLPGGKLRLTITGPDTDVGRAYLLDCLFTLQTHRVTAQGRAAGSIKHDKRGKGFPLLRVERPTIGPRHGEPGGGNAFGFACFTLTEDTCGGFPYFHTFGATREDLEAATRAEICLNRHSGMTDAEVLSLPHADDAETAYGLLLRTVADVLAGAEQEPEKVAALLEDLKAGYDEARRFHNPGGPIEAPAPPVRYAAPVDGKPCRYCSGTEQDGYKPCPFRGYRPGECFKLTGIRPEGALSMLPDPPPDEEEGDDDGPPTLAIV